MSEKLQKILARAGKGSRREMERSISEGKVSVNGALAKLGDRVDLRSNPAIRLDGQLLDIMPSNEQVCRILAYHKPEGELCTRNDPEGRPTVFERLPWINNGRWIAIGRLDINTSGLILFTNDGELANKLMHPSNEIQREYLVRVFGTVTKNMIQNLVNGVKLEDGMARFEDVVYSGGEGMNQSFYVVISEGRNREVRRLWASQDVTVSRLKRVRYGSIFLDSSLPKGGWAELELKDVNYLRELVELRPERNSVLHKDLARPVNKRKQKRQIQKAVKRHNIRKKR